MPTNPRTTEEKTTTVTTTPSTVSIEEPSGSPIVTQDRVVETKEDTTSTTERTLIGDDFPADTTDRTYPFTRLGYASDSPFSHSKLAVFVGALIGLAVAALLYWVFFEPLLSSLLKSHYTHVEGYVTFWTLASVLFVIIGKFIQRKRMNSDPPYPYKVKTTHA